MIGTRTHLDLLYIYVVWQFIYQFRIVVRPLVQVLLNSTNFFFAKKPQVSFAGLI